jgi:hypothetical protein
MCLLIFAKSNTHFYSHHGVVVLSRQHGYFDYFHHIVESIKRQCVNMIERLLLFLSRHLFIFSILWLELFFTFLLILFLSLSLFCLLPFLLIGCFNWLNRSRISERSFQVAGFSQSNALFGLVLFQLPACFADVLFVNKLPPIQIKTFNLREIEDDVNVAFQWVVLQF